MTWPWDDWDEHVASLESTERERFLRAWDAQAVAHDCDELLAIAGVSSVRSFQET